MSLFPKLPKKFWWQLAHDPKDKYLPLQGIDAPGATKTNAQSVGQIYIDTDQPGVYVAVSVTGDPLTDWVKVNP